jgi:hypothetical protein
MINHHNACLHNMRVAESVAVKVPYVLYFKKNQHGLGAAE